MKLQCGEEKGEEPGDHCGKETGDYGGRESFDLDFCRAS